MKKIHKALILSSAMIAGNSQAEIVLNGFASIVGGVTTAKDESLSGYDDSISFNQDSFFALQASSDLTEGLSVTAQIMARGENEWDPEFEWAYIAYEATDHLRILAGRQRVPFYMFSDFLDVSYAYPWITPTEAVYGGTAFNTFDGLGAVYTTNLASFDATIHAIYGENTSSLFDDEENAKFKDLAGAAVTLNRDWLTLRAGYMQTEMNIPVTAFDGLAAGWTLAGYANVGDNIQVSEDTASFMELAFQIDYENILIIGEYTELRRDDTIFSDDDSFYILGGYRFDDMLVHITYGGSEGSTDRITDGVSDLPDELAFLLPTTNGLTDSETFESTYVTLGLRWDFHDSAALKFEYTSFSDDLDSNNDAGLFRTALVTVF